MTRNLTDTELRDLLTAEAGGPTGGPGGWDDVVRRGRHRQRARRVQSVALVAVVAGLAATALALAADDPTVETVPPATDPSATGPTTTVTDSSAPPSTTALPAGSTAISAGRAQGLYLTLIIPPADPSNGFDPCTDLHPRTPQSADQIAIELVGEDVERGLPWVTCQSSAFSAWGTIELHEPYAGQPILDLSTGDMIPITSGVPLLFPTELPEPFDLGHWDEFASEGSWTFSWSGDDLYVNVTNGYGGPNECDREAVEVRGTEGRLCRGGNGSFDLHWEEGGRTIAIEIGNLADGTSPFTLDEVLAIAEGLAPLDG